MACYDTACYQLTKSGWLHYQDTLHTRQFHTSAVLQDGLLLAGGNFSPSTTEVVLFDGGNATLGFSLMTDRQFHCSIQVKLITRNIYLFNRPGVAGAVLLSPP